MLGTFLLVLAGLLTLSSLSQLATDRVGDFADPAEALGFFFAAGLSIGVPLVIGLILLLKKPKSPLR